MTPNVYSLESHRGEQKGSMTPNVYFLEPHRGEQKGL